MKLSESQVLFSALKEGRELPPQREENRTVKKTMMIIKKSSRMLERPKQMKKETKTFITMVEINGQDAVAQFSVAMARAAFFATLGNKLCKITKLFKPSHFKAA